MLNIFGLDSQKDAEKPSWGSQRLGIYLAALDALVEVLTKTPVRDTANNPVMQPVPDRPHLPISPTTTATLAE